MTIIITAIATLLLQYLYKEVKYRIQINKEAKQAGLKWMIQQEVLKYLEELKNGN